jgi:CO/xanthine dehydrogenase Mo-binding subunit
MLAKEFDALSRRAFLSATGALVVALATPAEFAKAAAPITNGLATRPPVTPDKLSSYISIEPDGTVVAYYGKIDGGQGLECSVAQLVAEEIDVPWERVRVVMGDSQLTVNMGGATAGNGMRQAGPIMRQTAAEARRLLIDMASNALGVPAAELTVTDGVVQATADPSKRITYAQLIGGRYFDFAVPFRGKAQQLAVKLPAPLKTPAEFKVIGKAHPRRDMPGKVFGTLQQCSDVRLPNMLHARTIRPTVAGAVPVTVDEKSIADIPGAKVVRIKDFLAVVAEKEWNAVRAAKALKVTWSQSKPNFPGHDKLYDHMRDATPRARSPERGGGGGGGGGRENGSVEDGFKQAARIIEAEYQYPMQSHASMGPACGVADVRDGGATVWTSTQKPYDCAAGIADLLELPPDKVRAIWMFGTGSYARNDQGDAVGDAALLSKHLNRPVRVQYMRHEGLAWDPKGPAVITINRAGLDASGKIIAYEHVSKGFSNDDCNTREQKAGDMLAGMLTGAPVNSESALGIPQNNYVFDHMRIRWEVVAPLMNRASPLRTTHLRDPFGVPHLFGMESFLDEIAVATNTDPIELRLRHLKKDREHEVIRAAAQQFGWDTRPSPRKDQATGNIAMGRGFAFRQMHDTFVATIAEVKVHRDTGVIEIERMVCAHDCGLIVNPVTIKHVIDRQMVWQTGRTLFEEVQFDENMVTSVDWLTYPVLKMPSAPKSIEIVLLNRPDIPFSGAAEHSCGPIPSAIGNAVFDATGVRLRRVPFTPERVKAALTQSQFAVKAAL